MEIVSRFVFALAILLLLGLTQPRLIQSELNKAVSAQEVKQCQKTKPSIVRMQSQSTFEDV